MTRRGKWQRPATIHVGASLLEQIKDYNDLIDMLRRFVAETLAARKEGEK